MDAIQIKGIRGYGYTGLLPEEQILGQWFVVDLTLWLNLEKSGSSDAIEDTLDYRKAIALVKHQITSQKYALVEKLAAVIAMEILNLDKLEQVRVQLTKVSPPIPEFEGKIIIDITRSRIG